MTGRPGALCRPSSATAGRCSSARRKKLLPPLLSEVAPIDLFIHDANHAYSAQLREYRSAWPHLRPGGVMVSDDVGNPAFVEFAAEVGAKPYLVPGSRSDSAVGVVRKD